MSSYAKKVSKFSGKSLILGLKLGGKLVKVNVYETKLHNLCSLCTKCACLFSAFFLVSIFLWYRNASERMHKNAEILHTKMQKKCREKYMHTL